MRFGGCAMQFFRRISLLSPTAVMRPTATLVSFLVCAPLSKSGICNRYDLWANNDWKYKREVGTYPYLSIYHDSFSFSYTYSTIRLLSRLLFSGSPSTFLRTIVSFVTLTTDSSSVCITFLYGVHSENLSVVLS